MANAFRTLRRTKYFLVLAVALAAVSLILLARKWLFTSIKTLDYSMPIAPPKIDQAKKVKNGSPMVSLQRAQIPAPQALAFPRTIVLSDECIANLRAQKACKSPVSVGVVSGNSTTAQAAIEHLHIGWTIEDRPERDFWLFRDVHNTTNSVAMKRFQTEHANMAVVVGGSSAAQKQQFPVEFPVDLPTFRRRWQNGRFLECQVLLKRNETGLQRFLPLTMIDRGAELTAHMEHFYITAMLFGGTLLGWRRECSLIPHTGDLDFAMFAQQHSEAFLDDLIHSQKFLLKWILGSPQKGLELTLWMDNFKTDIFYIYYNETRGQCYTTGMRLDAKQNLFWFYPRIDQQQLCTGELGGHLFHVPCNVDDILATEYGAEGWKVDFPTNQFAYDKSHKNKESGEFFTEEEWKTVYNLYYPKEEHNQTLPKWS